MDLDCGITFDIFTHVFTWVVLKFIIIYIQKKKEIQVDDLDEGYNVELKRIVKVTRSLQTLSL